MNTKIGVLIVSIICGLAASAVSVADSSDGETSKSKVFALIETFPEIFVTGKVKKAKSTLTRYDDQVCFTVESNSLPPGAYTTWIRAFADPDVNCTDGERIGNLSGKVVGGSQCSRRDIGATACNASGLCSVFWTTGAVVGALGEVNVSACVAEGELPGFVIFGPGITDAKTDELHIVLKYHGETAFSVGDPVEQARLGRQVSRLNGNCEPAIEPTDTLDRCPDLQIALHPGGDDDDD